MTVFSVDMEGLPEFSKQTAAIQDAIEANLRAALVSAGNDMQRTMVDSILREPKTGRVYGNHRASAPGEAPASDTGFLVSRILVFPELQKLFVDIGVKAQRAVSYAGYLEFGTQKMEPRPFVKPAFIKNKDKAKEKMRKAVRAGLDGKKLGK